MGDWEAAARKVEHEWSTKTDIKGGEKGMILSIKYSWVVKLKKKMSSVFKIKEIIDNFGKREQVYW